MMNMEARMERVRIKEEAAKAIERFLRETSAGPDELNGFLSELDSSPVRQKIKLHTVLLRPNVGMVELSAAIPALENFLRAFDREAIEMAEINMKYEGYIFKEREMADKLNRLEEVKLPENFDYQPLVSLSKEAKEKLSRIRPRTIGQAGRISGVTPADVSVLLVHIGR